MHQLIGLDGAFLAMETSAVFGHVGSVCIVDPSTSAVPLNLAQLTELIGSRLPLVPPYRRRLAEVPFGLDQPYWIEDPDFDLGYHVREIALPAPGTDAMLAEQAARLHARPLDRARPLWEMYLISGLSGGRMAAYTKVHHAAIDGVSGADIMGTLLDTTPEPREIEAPPKRVADRMPSSIELLTRSALSLTFQPVRAARVSLELLRAAPALVRSPGRPHLPVIDDLLDRGRSRTATLERPHLRAPRTPFNRPITPHRRFAFFDVPLADVKAIKKAAGVTINDVMMALCAGALRPHRLQRPRTEHPALLRGRPDALLQSVVRHRGRAGAQHHGDQLPRLDELRADRLPRARPRPGRHGRLPAGRGPCTAQKPERLNSRRLRPRRFSGLRPRFPAARGPDPRQRRWTRRTASPDGPHRRPANRDRRTPRTPPTHGASHRPVPAVAEHR